MARPRNIIPRIVGFDMVELASKILKMSDAELVAWLRKAVSDCIDGCKDPDCDPFIRIQFERSLNQMHVKQELDAQIYRNRLARQGKSLKINDQETTDVSTPETIGTNEASNPPTRESETRGPQTDNFNGDATTGDGVDAFTCRESGSFAHTTISNISQDAPNGNAGEANPLHPAPIAESARCATSEAVKALADGDIREDSLNMHDGSNAARMESGASAKTLTEARQSQARESRRTGGTPTRVEMPTASHAETLPVRSHAELKKPYGTCGHVMLTDTEGRHLREVYGPHLAIAIDILDGYIENDGKAAKKYKNHAAVLRKGNWVWNKVQEMILNEKRIENASKGAKNWKAEERERTARVLRGESADGKCYLRDDELTPEELEAKYG